MILNGIAMLNSTSANGLSRVYRYIT